MRHQAFGVNWSSSGANIRIVNLPSEGLWLFYRVKDQPVPPYTLPVTTTAPHYGSVRYWWLRAYQTIHRLGHTGGELSPAVTDALTRAREGMFDVVAAWGALQRRDADAILFWGYPHTRQRWTIRGIPGKKGASARVRNPISLDGRAAAIALRVTVSRAICSKFVHDNVRGEYNLRVAACRAGVGLLRRAHPGITHLRDVQEIDWSDLAPMLPDVAAAGDFADRGIDLGQIPGLNAHTPLRVAACCRHVWYENQRVLHALEMLRTGDVAAVGADFTAAHASARDDYAVSTPELDFLVETAIGVDGCVGARLTGAGWGGCIVALVAAAAVDNLAERLQSAYAAAYGRTPAVFLCQAGPGAGKVGELTL